MGAIMRAAAVAVCLVTCMGTMGGCGDKDNKSSAVSSEAEKVYGGHMRESTENDIRLLYDVDFLTDDEVSAMVKYYTAVENKDAQLFASLMPDDYIDYLSKQNGQTANTMLKNIYNELEESIGANYTFDYIEVTDCGTEETESGINDVLTMMDSIYEDAGEKESFSQQVETAKYVKFNLTVALDDSYMSKDDQLFYVFTTADGIYLI